MSDDATSIGVSFRSLQVPSLVGLMLAGTGTTSGINVNSQFHVSPIAEQTNAGARVVRADTAQEIADLRRLTGFTWEQLASEFNVSRRAVHFWASGKPMTAQHRATLQALLKAAPAEHLQTGSASGADYSRRRALSAAAQAARKPRPPQELVDAVEDIKLPEGRLLSSSPIRKPRET